MKVHVTQKAIKENFRNRIDVGYCGLANVLRYRSPEYYNAGVYGWNGDYYVINEDTIIMSGYRLNNRTVRPSYETTKKYEDEARVIIADMSTNYDETKKALDELLEKFIDEMLA